MGSIDIKRVSQNVIKAKHYGAKLTSTPGSLKDAITKVLKLWTSEPDSYYCCGSVVAAYPFPRIVQYAQSFIGKELREQILKKKEDYQIYLLVLLAVEVIFRINSWIFRWA